MEKIIVNTATIAQLFGVSEKYISELHLKHGLPKHGHDAWDLSLCVPFRLEQLKKMYESQVDNIRKEKSQDILALKSAELKDLTIQEKKKLLVNRMDVQTAWVTEIKMIIGKLEGIAPKLAPKVKGKTDETEIISIVTDELERVKDNIANTKLDIADVAE